MQTFQKIMLVLIVAVGAVVCKGVNKDQDKPSVVQAGVAKQVLAKMRSYSI